MNKLLLRKSILAIRDELTSEDRVSKSKKIANLLYSCEEYKNAKAVFIFVTFRSEVVTIPIIEKAFSEGKRVFVPVTNTETKVMYAIEIKSIGDLKRSSYGILEPVMNESTPIEPQVIDLAVVPGAVFDHSGNRIGYGAGYYDAFLTNNSHIYKIAIAFDFQVVDKVPTTDHDVPMNKLITDERLLVF